MDINSFLNQVGAIKEPILFDDSNVLYFLLQGREVVYVGITTLNRLRARMKYHANDPTKEFDSYVAVQTNLCREDVEKLETGLIIYMKPIYNKAKVNIEDAGLVLYSLNYLNEFGKSDLSLFYATNANCVESNEESGVIDSDLLQETELYSCEKIYVVSQTPVFDPIALLFFMLLFAVGVYANYNLHDYIPFTSFDVLRFFSLGIAFFFGKELLRSLFAFVCKMINFHYEERLVKSKSTD